MAKRKGIAWRTIVLNLLYERQDGKCLWCNEDFSKCMPAQLDHKIAISDGGEENDINNFQLLHYHCHKEKHGNVSFEHKPLCVSDRQDNMHPMEHLKATKQLSEKQTIYNALCVNGNNVTRTAQYLGISRKGLQLKMIKHDLRKPLVR